MRILILGIALLALSTFAFAGGATQASDETPDVTVTLSLLDWVAVTDLVPDATLGAFDDNELSPTLGTTAVPVPVDVKYNFTVTSNCPWHMSATQSKLASADDDILAGTGVNAVAFGMQSKLTSSGNGGDLNSVTAKYMRKGLDDNAGTYTGTLKVTVTAD